MGNLDNLGVIVVVLLLAGVIVVSFVVDPEDGKPVPVGGTRTADAGRAEKGAADPWAPDDASALDALRSNRPFERKPGKRFIDTAPDRKRSARPEAGKRAVPAAGRRSTQRPVQGAGGKSRFRTVAGNTPPRGVNEKGGVGGARRQRGTEAGRPESGKRPGRGKHPAKKPDAARAQNLPGPAERPASGGFPRTVTLRDGESVWKLAVREYGQRVGAGMVDRILSTNRISNPRGLRAGASLRLPAPPKASGRRSRKAPAPSKTTAARERALPFAPDPQEFSRNGTNPVSVSTGRWYVVQPGDSLSEIALRMLGSASHVGALKRLNGIAHEDRIQAGMRLRLPDKGRAR